MASYHCTATAEPFLPAEKKFPFAASCRRGDAMLGFQNARNRSKIDKPNPSDTAARRLGHCETCAPSSRWKVRLAIHCRSGLTAKSPASAGSLPSPDPRCYLYVTLTKSTWSPPEDPPRQYRPHHSSTCQDEQSAAFSLVRPFDTRAKPAPICQGHTNPRGPIT